MNNKNTNYSKKYKRNNKNYSSSRNSGSNSRSRNRSRRSNNRNGRIIFAIGMILVAVVLLVSVIVRHAVVKKSASTPTSSKTSSADASTPTTNKSTTTKNTTEKATEVQTGTTGTSSKSTSIKSEGSVDSKGKVTFKVSDDYKSTYTYCVAVNRQQNVVTAYKKDSSGNYTIPAKAMLCSCGIPSSDGGITTPTGTYGSLRKDRWLLLIGNSWGQYTTKIVGSIFFHSVPYYSKNASDLQYKEFPKLGSAASHGCIRISTADAKWLYDNLPIGTAIYIYDSNNPGPLGKPDNVPFDINSENKGWDPTDPDVNNPWNA